MSSEKHDSIYRNFLKILEFSIKSRQQNKEMLWPCLVGETGTGKTYTVNKVAEYGKFERVATILLGTMLPEEVLGIPRVIDGQTIWGLPYWFPKDNEKVLIFFDELDKASRDTVAAVLTLLSSCTVHGKELPDGCAFMCAMQPVDYNLWMNNENFKALSSRLLFFARKPNWNYVASTLPGSPDFEWLYPITEHGHREIRLPISEVPSPRQISWCYRFFAEYGLSLGNKNVVNIASTTLNHDIAMKLYDTFKDGMSNIYSPKIFIEMIEEDKEVLNQMTTSELTKIWPHSIIHAQEIWTFFDILDHIFQRGTIEEHFIAMANYRLFMERFINDHKEKGTKEIELWPKTPNSDIEKIAARFTDVLSRYVKRIQKISKDKQKNSTKAKKGE